MKYIIEIWKHHTKTDEYESNSIKKILKWYNKNYKYVYENGDCAFYVYKNNKELSFDEKYELGFYD